VATFPISRPKIKSGFRSSKEPELLEVPEWWMGSKPEYYIYHALISLGLKSNVDFVYQSAQLGGRLEKGGAVVDFLFYNPPNLAVNIQSVYYHYRGVTQKVRGQMQRAQLEGLGLRIVYIDEEDALRDPRFYAKEALNFRDHSRMTGAS